VGKITKNRLPLQVTGYRLQASGMGTVENGLPNAACSL
jgi:hypothetical protein